MITGSQQGRCILPGTQWATCLACSASTQAARCAWCWWHSAPPVCDGTRTWRCFQARHGYQRCFPAAGPGHLLTILMNFSWHKIHNMFMRAEAWRLPLLRHFSSKSCATIAICTLVVALLILHRNMHHILATAIRLRCPRFKMAIWMMRKCEGSSQIIIIFIIESLT